MRIGIDCRRLDPAYSNGLKSYTLGLLDGMAAAGNGHRFCLYVTLANARMFSRYDGKRSFETVVLDEKSLQVRKALCRAALLPGSQRLYKLTSDLAYEKIRAMMDADCDVLYTPTVVLQSFNNRRPTVVSMHDIQHVHYPRFFSWSRRLSRRITYGLSARYASYFQASSEFIKQDLLSHFADISARQIEVIPEGVNLEAFSVPRDTSTLRAHYGLPEKYLLYPAQLWKHKNHLTVLQALHRIEARTGEAIPLVLTGAKFSAASGVFRFLAEKGMKRVFHLGVVPFVDLVGLYQGAAFLISAGLYESSSLPVLEAAAAGVPIIASDIPPHEELAQRLWLNLFSPLNPEDLARRIHDLWNDQKTAAEQVAHNREHIAFYSWENAARKYVHLFERIVNA